MIGRYKAIVTGGGCVSDLLRRIERCRVVIGQHEEAVREEKKLRNSLIREALDAGEVYSAIARAAGLGKSRVATIAGEPD